MPDEEEDDDTFGDFEFVPSSSAAAVAFPSFPFVSKQQTTSAEDDEWGDFVDSTLESHPPSNDLFASQNTPLNSSDVHFSDPFGSLRVDVPEAHLSPVKSETKQWEKPRGALPLSLFGDEEKSEEEESETDNFMFKSADVFPTKTTVENGSSSAKRVSNTSITDLIANLYGSAEQIRTETAIKSDLPTNEDDFDENGWEFKDALSEISGGNGDSSEEQKVSEVLGLAGDAFLGSGNQVEKKAASSLSSENGHADRNFWGTFVGNEGEQNAVYTFGVDVELSTNSEIPAKDIKVAKGAVGSLSAKNGDVEGDFWGAFEGNEGYKQEQNAVCTFGVDFEVSTNNKIPANGIEAQHGTEGGSFDENGVFGDESWKFDDGFSVIGAQSVNSGTEQKSLEVSSFDKVASSDSRIQKIEENGEDPPRMPVSCPSNGGLDLDKLFEVQDGFVPKPSSDGRNGMNGFNLKVDAGLDDLISNLYAPEEPISVANLEKGAADNGVELLQSSLNDDLVNGEPDWDETDWEFKDASSETKMEDKIVGSWNNMSQDAPSNFKLQKFVEFYSKLKEESHALAFYHLEGLKKVKVAAALSGEEEKVMVLNEEIQSAFAKLGEETVAFEKVHPVEHLPGHHDRQLLQTLQDPDFGVFDSEYHLSSLLSLAQKDLNAAVRLFKHASLVNHILMMASMEEQTAYVSVWSKIVVVCAQELQHGSMIWKQSLQKKVQRELLLKPQALQYFLALREIYRVAEIIKASATLYRPWILLNSGQATNILSILNDCTTIWSEAGIKEVLEGMSDSASLGYDGSIKLPQESTESICDLDADALWSSSWQGYPVCRVSLLSSGLMQDIKTVLWNEEYLFVTLANLWANMISCDPPHLPHILIH
ncbi:hypothetical protein H6P81_002455 [Aristolochia fimbriata]|uniref:Synergin gamma C-terminal domain-containing protein n=1 Tax=Aristolochia fimbriata TaxID=158543 RepID=A0AAV7FD10_ARIFI|nr:hypothetical protein H6P81_002455 [Aristolochia fimbriata]